MTADSERGERDLERAAAALAGRVPPALAPLAKLAFDYRWSWWPGGPETFRAVDPRRWELCSGNPVRLLQESSTATLARAADDSALIARAVSMADAIAAERARPFAPGPFAPDDREIVPAFYERDEAGVPRAWVQRIKHSLRSIGPRFNAGRMLSDYTETVDRPR